VKCGLRIIEREDGLPEERETQHAVDPLAEVIRQGDEIVDDGMLNEELGTFLMWLSMDLLTLSLHLTSNVVFSIAKRLAFMGKHKVQCSPNPDPTKKIKTQLSTAGAAQKSPSSGCQQK
jgi:hypothetical protein